MKTLLLSTIASLALALPACVANNVIPGIRDHIGSSENSNATTGGERGFGVQSTESSAIFTDRERTGKRYALIIGNGEYDGKTWSQLSNPVNDAEDMKKTLESLPKGKDFEVTFLKNASHLEMEEAVRAFGRKLEGGGIGLFYYAGHGTQVADDRVEGKNYLIPVDLHSGTETDVKYKSLSADYVLETMENAKNGFNIVVLDACRTNGLARGKTRSANRSGGLAAMRESEGAIIAFSTAANKPAEDGTGRNSPYAKHLIEAVKTENLTLEQVFKRVRTKVKDETSGTQSPIEYTQLEGGDFCFVNCPGTQNTAEMDRLTREVEEARQQAEQERKARLDAEKQQQLSSGTESQQQAEEVEKLALDAKKRMQEAEKRMQIAEEAEKRALEAKEKYIYNNGGW